MHPAPTPFQGGLQTDDMRYFLLPPATGASHYDPVAPPADGQAQVDPQLLSLSNSGTNVSASQNDEVSAYEQSVLSQLQQEASTPAANPYPPVPTNQLPHSSNVSSEVDLNLDNFSFAGKYFNDVFFDGNSGSGH